MQLNAEMFIWQITNNTINKATGVFKKAILLTLYVMVLYYMLNLLSNN